jgi:NADP-dependent 3-hydroxy acid dehydrogenase YdfG
MDQTLDGHKALITGASRGIGRAIAIDLAKAGCDVALFGRDEEALEAVAAECAEHCERALYYALDLRDEGALQESINDVAESFGGELHIVINNAGVLHQGGVNTAEMSTWDAMIDINLRAAMQVTRLSLPHFASKGQRAVINIASMAGRSAHAGLAGYCASKYGLIGFSHAAFADLRERGIKVSAICPGYVNTDMVAGAGLSSERMIQPQDVASAVRFVIEFPSTSCPVEIQIMPQKTPYH